MASIAVTPASRRGDPTTWRSRPIADTKLLEIERQERHDQREAVKPMKLAAVTAKGSAPVSRGRSVFRTLP
jgi:hypothetical protein